MHFSKNMDDKILRQIILDHYNNPNNKTLDINNLPKDYLIYNANNLSCIDDIVLAIKFDENNKIIDAKFNGIACAICTASTDIFCDLIKGKTIKDAKKMIENYHLLLKNSENCDLNALEEAIAFKNVYRQISRIGCATLGINAITTLFNQYETSKNQKQTN